MYANIIVYSGGTLRGPCGLVRAFNHIFHFFCKEFLRNYV